MSQAPNIDKYNKVLAILEADPSAGVMRTCKKVGCLYTSFHMWRQRQQRLVSTDAAPKRRGGGGGGTKRLPEALPEPTPVLDKPKSKDAASATISIRLEDLARMWLKEQNISVNEVVSNLSSEEQRVFKEFVRKQP